MLYQICECKDNYFLFNMQAVLKKKTHPYCKIIEVSDVN